MTFASVFRLLVIAFWCFIVFASLVSNAIVNKTIANINSIFNIQKTYRLHFTFQNFFNENFAQKTIIMRNIFNVTGEIPQEDLESNKIENEIKNFSGAPCSPSSEQLPVDVVGIIYTGNAQTNLVTVQDPDIEGADVYHEGDQILDYNGYFVYRVASPTSVEFRYGSKKICRSLVSALPGVVQNADGTFELPQQTPSEETNTIVLTHDYVEQELGTGLSKIVNSVRIAPSIVDGQLEGFKIFSIAPGSLFEKIGLVNGDVVTEINNQKLNDPAKGFLIYDAFQYENQILFAIKRGTERVTRKVIIK